ncbi:MAG: hypothetical protein PF795_14575 [Kiritimatiellae bacterium]|jgi:hypothetical protein|nr:hypothetical protein [Kiritimatiellia bacterium]
MCGNERIRIRWVYLFAFFCLFRLGSSADSIPLLNVQVADWTSPSDSGDVAGIEDGFAFACDFSGAGDRFFWDVELEQDLSAHDGVWVEFQYENPASFRAVTLHFQSGAGWYAITLPVSDHSQSLFFPFESFEVQGSPGGWDGISRFRVSPWKGGASSGRFILKKARVERTHFLLVEPRESDFPSVEERSYARRISDGVASHFMAMGVPLARLSDAKAAEADLDRFDVILFPLNPTIPNALSDALSSYLSKGGKLAVFYSSSAELAERAGFNSVRYLSAPRTNHWNAFSFDDEEWRGPDNVVQANTDNLIVVPVSGESRVLAWWEDGFGRRQGEPAVVLSKHALWFSSVLTPENEDAKRRMLAFALDRLQPESGIAQAAASSAFARARDRTPTPWNRFLAEFDSDGSLKTREKRVEDLLAAGKASRAWEAVDELSSEIDLRIAGAADLPASRIRGVWDHSGVGVTQGAWEDTFSLLASANLTDYFMFVSRQSPVPSRAIAAAETSGIGVHAWHICFNLYGVSPTQVRRYEREGRLQINQDGETLPWLCPSNERNRKVELRRLSQLAETRGLRGLHLDYVRWPDGVYCTCPSCKEVFTRYVGTSMEWPRDAIEGKHHATFLEWRTGVISSFMEAASRQLREQPSEILLSAAVWPAYPEVINRLGQDWGGWMKDNWLDFVVPMNYTSNSSQFKVWIQHQTTVVPDPHKLVAGIGYRASESRLTPAQVLDHIRISDEAGASGYVLFQLNPSFQSELIPVLQVGYERGE